MQHDTTKTITHSLLRFFSGTIMSRITGMGRDMVMASLFGAHPSVAAFFVAFRLSHLLRKVLGEGALQTAFVPQFEKVRCHGTREGDLFFGDLIKFISTILIFIIVIGELILGTALYTDYFSAGNQEIAFMTAILLPGLLFICLFGLNSSRLQCEGEFFIPSAAPVAFNLMWIATLLFLQGYPAPEAMPYLAFGVTLGCIMQWWMTHPKAKGLTLIDFSRPLITPEIRTLGGPLLLGILGISAIQINGALDYFFARSSDPAGPAYLWYGLRIQQVPIALFGIGMSGAILPPLSRAWKVGDLDKYKEFILYSVRKCAVVMIPFTFALFFLSLPGLNLVYGRGQFGVDSLINTTMCVWGYSVGLLPTVLIHVLAPAFYAKGDYNTPMRGAVGAVAVNIFLNSLFVYSLGYGPASVALATSIGTFFNAWWLIHKLRKEGSFPSMAPLITVLWKGAIVGIMGSLAIFAYDPSALKLVTGVVMELPTAFLDQAMEFISGIVVFAGVSVLAAWTIGLRLSGNK
jgi:putative peptidoglycan lipid II flippase